MESDTPAHSFYGLHLEGGYIKSLGYFVFIIGVDR